MFCDFRDVHQRPTENISTIRLLEWIESSNSFPKIVLRLVDLPRLFIADFLSNKGIVIEIIGSKHAALDKGFIDNVRCHLDHLLAHVSSDVAAVIDHGCRGHVFDNGSDNESRSGLRGGS